METGREISGGTPQAMIFFLALSKELGIAGFQVCIWDVHFPELFAIYF